MGIFTAYNGPMPTTAAQAKVTTGTAIKTMLQLATPSTVQLTILSWGFSLDASPASGGLVELIETDVAATTGTAHVAAGVQPQLPGQPASLLTLGTGATGYTFTVEGSTTASRVFGYATAGDAWIDRQYVREFVPGREPVVAVSKFLRIRSTFGTAVNMTCWITWSE
jgi:hypothetical protein